jgi:predicted nucleic acid-binding Zn ribbon protein
MPRWDFRCVVCGRVVELSFKSAAARDNWIGYVACDDPCLGMMELPAAPSFTLKGSGFHVNDYKKGGNE